MIKKAGKKILRGQTSIAFVLFLLAGAAMWFYHTVFDREPGFSKNLTGILVMRIVGDDMFDSLQRELVEKLTAGLQQDPAGKQIEVHAGRETIDENNGLDAAYE